MTQCSHPHHHHDAESLVREVALQCQIRGLRLTALRERILELIVQSQGPAKAYDLLKTLKSEHDSAAPPTVYRALDFLLEHGFVHKVESINAFVACPHPAGAHIAQFLVCDRCGSAVELESDDLPQRLLELSAAQQFTLRKLVVEVHGTCRNCTAIRPLVLAPVPVKKSLTHRKVTIRDV